MFFLRFERNEHDRYSTLFSYVGVILLLKRAFLSCEILPHQHFPQFLREVYDKNEKEMPPFKEVLGSATKKFKEVCHLVWDRIGEMERTKGCAMRSKRSE